MEQHTYERISDIFHNVEKYYCTRVNAEKYNDDNVLMENNFDKYTAIMRLERRFFRNVMYCTDCEILGAIMSIEHEYKEKYISNIIHVENVSDEMRAFNYDMYRIVIGIFDDIYNAIMFPSNK